MLHVPVAHITEKLRSQTLEDDLKVSVPREGRLQIEGKNVWLSSDADNKDLQATKAQDSSGFLSYCAMSSSVGSRTHHGILGAPRFPKNKPQHNRHVCDTIHGIMLAPPKKKHCRSLSVPADTPPTVLGNISATSSGVFRPIPLTALKTSISSNNMQDNRNMTGFTSYRPDGQNLTSFVPPAVHSGCRFHRDFKAFTCVGSSGCSDLPVAPSHKSVDSGRDTTSDFQTPPSSPVPRPSSASSHTSLYCSAPWLDSSPGRLRYDVLQARSQSCEEQISAGLTIGSTPCVIGSGSIPSSPCRSKIPRCHSQPCVLHDRRCGKKRRRDADRPTLDFHKMTETAYSDSRTGSQFTPAQDIQKWRWTPHAVDCMMAGGLMPIASSPRDSDLPATPQNPATFSGIESLDCVTDRNRISTPPDSQISSGIDIQEPVKFLGEEEEDELDEDDSKCDCHEDLRSDEGAELFPLIDLDLDQIENH